MLDYMHWKRGGLMPKICFFDIDGTIVGHSRKISDVNKAALQQLRNNGHLSVLCTGRSPASIPSDLLDVGFDAVVASAGSYILIDDKLVYEHAIDSNVLLKVIYLFFKNDIMFSLEAKDYIYQSPGVKDFFDNMMAKRFENNLEAIRAKEDREFNARRRTFSEYDGVSNVAKITFISRNKETYEKVRPYLTEFNVVIFSKEDEGFINGELILKEHTKGDGLRYVMEYFHGSIEDTIAFGDSMNDYEMLLAAHESYVSELSADNLKAISNGTFKDPDEDGISFKLQELNLI